MGLTKSFSKLLELLRPIVFFLINGGKFSNWDFLLDLLALVIIGVGIGIGIARWVWLLVELSSVLSFK